MSFVFTYPISHSAFEADHHRMIYLSVCAAVLLWLTRTARFILCLVTSYCKCIVCIVRCSFVGGPRGAVLRPHNARSQAIGQSIMETKMLCFSNHFHRRHVRCGCYAAARPLGLSPPTQSKSMDRPRLLPVNLHTVYIGWDQCTINRT